MTDTDHLLKAIRTDEAKMPESFDRKAAEEFVAAICDDIKEPQTWQTFTDDQSKKTGYSGGDPLAKIIHASFADALPELLRMQGLGAGVYLTINKTNLTGRTAADVVALRSGFIDKDDGASVPDIWPLEPSIIIRRSDSERWHAHWLLKDGEPLGEFAAMQEDLISYWRSDPVIKYLNCVMRVPGFWHLKNPNKPMMYVIERCHPARRYTVNEIRQAMPARASDQKRYEPVSIDPNGIKEGSRNSMLTRLGGSMRRTGMGPSAIEAALVATNAEKCKPPLPIGEVRSVVQSVCRYDPDQITQALTEGWYDNDRMGDSEDFDSLPKTIDPGKFPPELLTVPGLIANMVAHISESSTKVQPLLAMMASVAMMGALIGRKVRTENDSRSNLYFVGLCKTGGGKDAARKAIKAVMFAAGLEQQHLMPEKIASEAAVLTYVRMRPSALFLIDEIGRTLQAINGKNSSSHEVGIITILMELFTSANSIYLGKAYADAKLSPSPPIHNPNACLYSTSNPGDFYAALTGKDVVSGFLPRFIVAEVDDHNPEPVEDLIPPKPPANLVDAVKAWASFSPAAGNLQSSFPEPAVVLATADAKLVFKNLGHRVRKEALACRDEAVAAIGSRVEEKAHRLALVYACSASMGSPSIGIDAATWACQLSEWSARKMLCYVEQHVAENETESISKRILRMIGSKGEYGLSMNELTRKTQWLKKREREDYIRSLMDSGLMHFKDIKTATKPRRVLALGKA
jgi:hypothetical protein